MTDEDKQGIGQVAWLDLTVPNAEQVRDFYRRVVGWKSSSVDMGEYSDFNMLPSEGGQPVAGICHARGSNADLPPHWLVYINVVDVDESARTCTESGGMLRLAPRDMGGHRFCVIEDPAGAVAALICPRG